MDDRHADDPVRPFDHAPCPVSAFGVVRVPFPEIVGLRKAPGPLPPGMERIPPSLMKHADHQTLLALAAVLKASADFGLKGPFSDWAVIAAPRFLGRVGAAGAMFRFTQTGPPGVSPLIIPTMALHAVAGSLSMALKSHGFNYGVGGGPNHVAEALTSGLAARDEPGVAGVWVVATGFDPEPIPDISGDSLTPSTGVGVALALRADADAKRTRRSLRVIPTNAASIDQSADSDPHGGEPLTPLRELAAFLEAQASGAVRRWFLPLHGGLTVVLDDDPARASLPGDSRLAG